MKVLSYQKFRIARTLVATVDFDKLEKVPVPVAVPAKFCRQTFVALYSVEE